MLSFQINYYTGVDGITIPLKIRNCTEICPIKTFLYSIIDILPENTQRLCHCGKIDLFDQNVILNDIIYSRSVSHTLQNIMHFILLVITVFV